MILYISVSGKTPYLLNVNNICHINSVASGKYSVLKSRFPKQNHAAIIASLFRGTPLSRKLR